MIDYTQHRAALETTYEDRGTISRYIETKTASKETKLSPAPVPVYSDQPCRISQKALGTNDQTEVQNNIRYETKLFIAPELDIRQGDILVVTRGRITPTGWVALGPARTYQAGEPFPYTSHQEVSLQRRGYA